MPGQAAGSSCLGSSGGLTATAHASRWSAREQRQTVRRRPVALTLILTALVALALDHVLAAYADSVRWTRATPNEWITTAALSFIGSGIILHVGIGLRWPFAQKTMEENP